MTTSNKVRWLVSAAALGAAWIVLVGAGAPGRQGGRPGATLQFRAQEIASAFGVGYAVVPGDVDGDGRTDILAISGTDLVWFQAPTWERKVILSAGATTPDNVTLAPHDIDKDGRLDVALGAGWTGRNTGTLQWVRQNAPGATPAWEVFPISAEPTLHRIRWADVDGDKKLDLIVAPLHGRGARGPDWDGPSARVLVFRPPANPRTDPWPMEVAAEANHIQHNFLTLNLDDDPQDEIITASKEGLYALKRSKDGTWSRTLIGEGAPGEVKLGRVGGRRMLATVDPWHGARIVVYAERPGVWAKTTIETALAEGHALGWADFDGDGNDELAAGWRGAPTPGLAIYVVDREGSLKSKTMVDDGGMATEDLIVGDFNGDEQPDVVASGRSTRNIKIYWNETKRARLGAVLQAGTPGAAEPLRVLFVGNSYTYFNNAPQIFAELARAATAGRQVETRMVAIPGETLLSLWERSEARQVLRASKWDYVVMQDQSLLGEGLRDGKFVVNSPRLLHWGARLFDGEIRQAGARTVLIQTWSRRDEPAHQADLDFAYDSVARDLRAILAPVGRAWQRARHEHPGLDLYARDGSHPSPAGSYLLACTLLSALFPEADRELPSSVSGQAVSGGGAVDATRDVVLVTLSADHAKQLQSLARSSVNDLRQQGGYLNVRQPERVTAMPPAGQAMQADRLGGAWTGELTYYPSPAVLNATFRFEGHTCQGEVAIQIPDRRQRYEAPMTSCSLAEHSLTFSVVTLPLPLLIDRFTGRLVDDRLVGTVERTGRELTNSMYGVWSLRRQTAQAHDERKTMRTIVPNPVCSDEPGAATEPKEAVLKRQVPNTAFLPGVREPRL